MCNANRIVEGMFRRLFTNFCVFHFHFDCISFSHKTKVVVHWSPLKTSLAGLDQLETTQVCFFGGFASWGQAFATLLHPQMLEKVLSPGPCFSVSLPAEAFQLPSSGAKCYLLLSRWSNLCIWQIFIECLLCAMHNSRHWGYDTLVRKNR